MVLLKPGALITNSSFISNTAHLVNTINYFSNLNHEFSQAFGFKIKKDNLNQRMLKLSICNKHFYHEKNFSIVKDRKMSVVCFHTGKSTQDYHNLLLMGVPKSNNLQSLQQNSARLLLCYCTEKDREPWGRSTMSRITER